VEELLSELPVATAWLAGGGELARAQVSQEVAATLLAKLIRTKAGPEGGDAHKAIRAWRLLQKAAQERGLPDCGLPSSPALVAEIVASELCRALREASGSQGGRTVGTTILKGFEILQAVGLPIAAKHPLPEAAAVPPRAVHARPRKHAGSLPLKIQLQLETLAGEAEWSVARVVARCFLLATFVHNTRLNDALNTELRIDELEPEAVVRGTTHDPSKDGLPLELYAPAEGWLGDFTWYREHMREMEGREHAMPAFAGGKAGRAWARQDGAAARQGR
jgi:hypothetical protein